MLMLSAGDAAAQRIQQQLGRGVVTAKNGSDVLVSWRRLAQEPENTQYNVYVNGTKVNASPLANTNWKTTSSVVKTGSKVTVTTVINGKESEQSAAFTVQDFDCRSMFMDIKFTDSPLDASQFNTSYVWPADLDGDGEYDYVVNRMSLSNSLDCYVEGYLRTGEHLWTVKMGPNELICSGQDDQILAYDMDCDGKAEVVMQTSDGTRFWDSDAKDFGLYVNGNTTGDTDGDGIIDYETQSKRNAPRYMTVVDGMTGREKVSVEQSYNTWYNRTNRAALMGDEYNKHVGHVGVFYHDGIHPAIVMEWHTRGTGGDHHYYNIAFAYDFTSGKAANWHELFNEPTGGATFHQIRVADPDGDGRDEMIEGGYTMDHDGSTLFNAGIAHGDRFRTTDIDPEHPGLETFAIQQNAGDMLGQILYDAATGEPIKKWYLPAVGDVGRGECIDIDPSHYGLEMWSTMEGVYNAKGDRIPELSSRFPTEGLWWDGDLDRETVETSDSHYNVYINDYYKGRLIEIAKLSGYRYVTVYAKRAAFWGDITGDWREELILRHLENGVCVGISGFTTDYATDVNNIYCLQEDPAYRMQCTTKGYYQSPNTGFYLGYDMPRPQLPPVMVTDVVAKGSGTYTAYDHATTKSYSDGMSVLYDLTTDADISLNSEMKASTVYMMPVKGHDITVGGSGSFGGDGDIWKSQQGCMTLNVPIKTGGKVYISEGTLCMNADITGDVELRARGNLAGNMTVGGTLTIEGALNYAEGCLMPHGTITFAKGLDLNKHLFIEYATTEDLIKVNGNLTVKEAPTVTVKFDNREPGRYKLIEYTGEMQGDAAAFKVHGLTGYSYNIINEDGAIWLCINDQRNAAENVYWTGAVNSAWDFQTDNFNIEGNATTFVAGDKVIFDDAAITTVIDMPELMPVEGVEFRNETKEYTVNGDGGFSGNGGLVKNGNGKLTLNTAKSDYKGATIINGGTVTVKELSDGGIAGSLGAASADAANLQIGKATLIIDNTNTATDRGITLTDTASVQIASGTASLKGVVKGKGTLVKKGGGQLNITYAGSNTWAGGTILENGTLAMGAWNTTFGISTSPITAKGGTIRIFDCNSSSTLPVFNNALEVIKGKTLSFIGGSRCKVQGKLTGEGTIKVSFPYVRGDVSTDMSGFKGTYEVTSGQLRLIGGADLSQAGLKLNAGVYVAHYKSQSGTEENKTTKIGNLSSTATDCTLSTGTWNIGYDNTNSTYAGVFNGNATINKYGTGTLTLSGAGQGKVNINEGIVSLRNTSAETTTGLITVNNGGMVIGNGKAADVKVNKGGTIGTGSTANAALSTTLTLTGNLTVAEGGKIRIRMRKSGQNIRNDALSVAGNVTLDSPVFNITPFSGEIEFADGNEIKVFTGSGSITLTGTPTFEPSVPGAGFKWDYSTLTTDGVIRVVADPTGVGNISDDTATRDKVYDTAGRKRNAVNAKGIYIINGKKIAK